MTELIETIQLAVADDATSEAKQAGANACRTLLAALEPSPTTALAAPTPARTSPLAGMDATHVLDLAIAKLRAMANDAEAPSRPQTGYRVQLIPVPRSKP